MQDTEITQPCDRSNEEEAPKKINDCVLVGKDRMRNSLGNIFKEHEDKYGALQVHQKKLFINGILRVQLALQHSMRPKLITDCLEEERKCFIYYLNR